MLLFFVPFLTFLKVVTFRDYTILDDLSKCMIQTSSNKLYRLNIILTQKMAPCRRSLADLVLMQSIRQNLLNDVKVLTISTHSLVSPLHFNPPSPSCPAFVGRSLTGSICNL